MEKAHKISTFVFLLGLLLLAIYQVYSARVFVLIGLILIGLTCLILPFIFGAFNFFMEKIAIVFVKNIGPFNREIKQALDLQKKIQ